MSRVLITGAAGFIGKEAVRHFLDQGYYVRAMTRSLGRKGDFLAHPKLEIVEGDLTNIKSLYAATENISFVIHLAGAKQDEKDSFDINVQGAKNLVEACRKNNVRRIVNVSTSSTKIKNRGAYGESKNQADTVFSESGLSVVTLKPSLVYGDLKTAAFGSLAKFCRLPVMPMFGSGDCLFRPIHIADVARAMQIAIENNSLPSNVYDVVGSDIISMNALVKTLGNRFFDKKVRIMHLPTWVGSIVALALSKFFYKSPITQSNILGSTQNIEMNHQQFFDDFNFIPRTLEEGFVMLEKDFKIHDEASLILNYVVSRSFPKIKITERERGLYYKAFKNADPMPRMSSLVYRFPLLVGSLDFLSRFYPQSNLSKKIYVAVTIVECSSISAEWLLPKKKSIGTMFLLSTYLVLSWVLKVVGAIVILPFQKFIEKNVR